MTVVAMRKMIGGMMVAASALALAGAANATITIKTAGFDANGSRTGDLDYTATNGKTYSADGVSIGRFQLTGTDDATKAAVSYLSYCIDPFQSLSTGGPYTLTALSSYKAPSGPASFNLAPVQLTTAKQDALNALISHADVLVNNADRAAAVQLAVWEIVYENDGLSGFFPLSFGTFQASNGTIGSALVTGTARNYATTYIDNIAKGVWTKDTSYSLNVLQSASYQDQLVFSRLTTPAGPVPEPATWAMFIGGFGLVGGAMRRSRTKIAFA